MPDSAFVALYHNKSILFLKRSNGHWWLPGGKSPPDHYSSTNTIMHWTGELLTLGKWQPTEIGRWRLTQKAGDHDVVLFEYRILNPELVQIRDPALGLSMELAWFTRMQIWDQLYVNKTMPWGQAKMAIYCLYDLYRHGQRANGELLIEDLKVDGLQWNRPLETG